MVMRWEMCYAMADVSLDIKREVFPWPVTALKSENGIARISMD